MATSNERDERRRRFSEKGLNRMTHITAGRAQSISSYSLPPFLDDDHQPPPSHLHQTKEREEASDERRKIAERGLHRTSRITTQSNPPVLEHHALFSSDHRAPQTYLSDQISA